ncbi:hypothetical protein DSO57_1033220 [Entomophthora muscae]|uniref:Uncharacterized protein n=1 Tax=Entomophthora muscae TaxID=34485 RepID=A0ACC2TYU2_9FUNG|nr:hypothetical protein DSO57_1033220 [Entomophthora muscae]
MFRAICVLIFWQGFGQALTLDSDIIKECPNSASDIIQIKDFKLDINSKTNQVTVVVNAGIRSQLETAHASISLSIFGAQVFALPFDLCTNVMGHGICPIHPGDISQDYALDIPSSLPNVAGTLSKVPGADVSARLTITDSAGSSLGCVAVGLANPTSAQQPALIGITAGLASVSATLAIVSGVLSAMLSVVPISSGGMSFQVRPGTTPSFFDLMATFQFMATTGQLSLNYPDIYQQFTTNFGWSMGMIRIGVLQDVVTSKAKESPALVRRTMDLIPSKNTTSYSELAGVGSYARKLGVSPNTYFLTVLALFALIMGAITFLVLLLRIVLELLSTYKPNLFLGLRNHYAYYYVGNLLRVFLLCYFVLATAALFQLTLTDSMLTRVVAGIVLGFFCILLMVIVSVSVIRAGPVVLYTEPKYNYRYGALYSDYRQQTYAFFLIVLLSSLLRAAAVGALGKYVWVQLLVLVVTEMISFLALFFLRPYATRLGNTLMIFIGVMRVTNTALLFAFIQSFFLPDLARTILAIAIIAIQGLTLVALAIMTVWGFAITIARLIKSQRGSQLPRSVVDKESIEPILASDYFERKEKHAPPEFGFFRARHTLTESLSDTIEDKAWTMDTLNSLSNKSLTDSHHSSSRQNLPSPSYSSEFNSLQRIRPVGNSSPTQTPHF